MYHRKRAGRRRKHRATPQAVKGKGFLKTLGNVGKFALNFAPLALAALGRRRRHRKSKKINLPPIIGKGVNGNPFTIV
jgi:hypothetical protein